MFSFFKGVLPSFLRGNDNLPNKDADQIPQNIYKQPSNLNNEPIIQSPNNNNSNQQYYPDKNNYPYGQINQNTQQNLVKSNQYFVDDIVNKANFGVNLFNQGKYKESKEILFPCCQQLMAIYKTSHNIAIKEYLVKYIKYSEECQKILSPMENKDFGKLSDSTFMNIIKETIMDGTTNIKFDDIIGLEKEKEIFYECLIYPNLRPDLFQGIRSPPRGILLYGPPGNGKTLFAKAIASECNATFFNMSASYLVSKYFGDSEKIMRALFKYATEKEPSIIFIDEIDSILMSRSENEHEASRRLKTEFLIQFDGLGASDQSRVFVIGATNRPQELDNAVIRRFTKRIYIPTPSKKAITHLIKYYLNTLTNNISEYDLDYLSSRLIGYSCSDIKALVKEACLEPLREIKSNNISTVKESMIRPVERKDIEKATKFVLPSVSKNDIETYEVYQKKFREN